LAQGSEVFFSGAPLGRAPGASRHAEAQQTRLRSSAPSLSALGGLVSFDSWPSVLTMETPTSYVDGTPSVGGPCTSIDEDEVDLEDEDEETRNRAESRVGSIIAQATRQLDDACETADNSQEVGQAPQAMPKASSKSARRRAMGTGATPNLARGAEIAQILAVPQHTVDVRAYAERLGYGRVPPFLREIEAELDAEQEYIVSLQEERKHPKTVVRLLGQHEKEELIQGLKQQLARASAAFLQAPLKSRSREELEAQLQRIKQDIDNLSRPYIFVEDGS